MNLKPGQWDENLHEVEPWEKQILFINWRFLSDSFSQHARKRDSPLDKTFKTFQLQPCTFKDSWRDICNSCVGMIGKSVNLTVCKSQHQPNLSHPMTSSCELNQQGISFIVIATDKLTVWAFFSRQNFWRFGFVLFNSLNELQLIRLLFLFDFVLGVNLF